jgi:inosine-uridine nucleoside N-ribohydrolase
VIGGVLLGMMLALAGCGIARQAPPVPSAAGRHKILLVGDELLGRAATRIAPSLAFSGLGAQVVDLTAPGTGLLDAGIMDSLRARFDANPDASMVVVEFMGNCAACPAVPGSPEHTRQWIAAAQQLIDEIRGRGMIPIWVVAPPVAPGLANAPVLKALADEGLSFARANGVVVANWADAFTDVEGRFLPTLYYARTFEPAAWHDVRVDGVGFTDDGAARAATWTAAAIREAWTVPLIVDTDMFLDVDDAGGLAVAFAMQQLGEAEIVALGIDLRADRSQVAATSWRCAAAIAAFYTGSTVPLGVAPPRDGVMADLVDYSAPCAAFAPPSTPPPLPVVEVYRRALATQPDGSVVVAGTGYAGNLAALLESGPDAISPLTGRELVAQKVRVLVVMGGGYPNSDGEHNLQGDISAAQVVAANWPTKVVWSGVEVGLAVVTGGSISARHPASSPVRTAYEAFVGAGNRWWSWDLTAVYHAIRPADSMLEEIGPGTNRVDDTGGNEFTPGAGNQYYLRLADGAALADSLDRLLDVLPH